MARRCELSLQFEDLTAASLISYFYYFIGFNFSVLNRFPFTVKKKGASWCINAVFMHQYEGLTVVYVRCVQMQRAVRLWDPLVILNETQRPFPFSVVHPRLDFSI